MICKTTFINAHTHDRDDNNVISIVSYRIGVDTVDSSAPFTMGVHPWDTQSFDVNAIRKTIIPNENLKAIGEIGLDYAKGKKNRNIQLLYFRQQLDIAESMDLGAVIHCVKAYDDMMPILQEYAPKLKFIMLHGFIGDPQLAVQLTKMGVYLSFGFTSLNSNKTEDSIRRTPLEMLFLETDDMDNRIEEMYEEVSVIKGCSVEELKEQISNNYQKTYGE